MRLVQSLVIIVALVGGLAACASVSPEEFVENDGLRQGGGLFSGEDGRFTVYSD